MKKISRLKESPTFGHHVSVLLLIIHLILVSWRVRVIEYYKDDPLALSLIELKGILMFLQFTGTLPNWTVKALTISKNYPGHYFVLLLVFHCHLFIGLIFLQI